MAENEVGSSVEVEVGEVDGGYVVGVDVGGTSTRALAVGLDGGVAGRGEAGGANPNSHLPELAAKRVAEAVAASLGELDPAGVRQCVLGMAGASKLSDRVIADVFHANLRQVGLSCPITVVSDAEVAYSSATAEPDGTVLIGGTGSIAARIVNYRKAATVGGFGWLLGDEGSAYWIGREAVRATLRILQSDTPLGPLAAAVLAEARHLPEAAVAAMAARQESILSNVDSGERRQAFARLITSVNGEPPIRLARFASIVSTSAPDDPIAKKIVGQAATLLAEQAMAARTPGERTPIVLVGSVIGPGSPVGAAVRALLAEDRDVPVLFATDGAVGAAWLAALTELGPSAPRPRQQTQGFPGA